MGLLKFIISRFSKKRNGIFANKLTDILGFQPKKIDYYRDAFTHPSARQKVGGVINYERLEFLGDAILGAIVAEFLFKNSPEKDEGYLTKMRSKMVQRNHLNELGKDLNLIQFLRYEGNFKNLGDNLYGNLFEAFVGAIYLDVGYKKTSEFIHRVLINSQKDLKELESKITSYKSLIVEWGQKNKLPASFNSWEDLENKKDAKIFRSEVFLGDKLYAKASDTSKKRAEEKASKRAYYYLQAQKIKNKRNKE